MEEIHGGRLKAEDILHVLRDRVAELPGTRDRESRPVIVFPARETTTPLIPDHIRNILIYLHTVTSDECKERGFVFIIDMRRGTTWSHDHFPANVHIVLIIKPDNFWEKHKTSASSGKYKFEVQMISVENLTRFIEPSQLTREFGGTLFYDHDEWLEMRLELEKLIWRMIDVRENFETYRKEIENAALPIDVATAERATNSHIALKKKIISAPIDSLQTEVQGIVQRISGSSALVKENGFNLSSNYATATANPDLAATLPHLSLLVERLRLLKDEIFAKWEVRRQQLDHCYQLKLFEQDAEKMFEWIRTHFTLSTQKFLDIGDSKQATELLIAEHREFEKAANNTEVNISHVMTVAKRLQEVGNYGKTQIENMAIRLDEEWQRFKGAVDSRTKLLELALAFHQKSSIYLTNYSHWLEVVNEGNNIRNRTADELESAIAEHKRFGENFVQIYAEAVGNGRALTHRLKCIGGEAVIQNDSFILAEDIIQKITHAQKQLYSQWESQRLKLHSRLALIAFETDTHLVLQWLEQHGDAYLSKNTAIGLNLSQAKALQRNHSHFRSVAANTYSNANKLFTASKTIVETGEGDARQMGAVVEELRRRIEQFSAKVEARRLLLDKSVLFHTHHYEMIQWYNSMEAKGAIYEKVSLNVKEGEHRKEEWNAECEATTQAYNTTKNEGLQLVKALEQQARTMEIDNRETVDVIEGLVSEIEQRHVRLLDSWPRQKQALQLGVRFAIFINDCKQIVQQLKNWQDDMTSLMRSENLAERAERILPYQEENTEQVEGAVCKIKEAAAQLNKDLENSEICLSDADGVLASILVRRSEEQLLYCKNEVMKVAYETRLRIERCMQLSRARALAQQAIETMGREELNLIRTNVIPTNLDEALEAQIAHDKFQHAMKKTYLIISDFVEKTDQLMKAGSIDAAAVSVLNEQVCSKWVRLLGLNEERNKLIKAAIGCYKTFHQAVLPILDQLEKEYSIGAVKDWCKEPVGNRVTYISVQLSKHIEYKERFLKGCSYAQKTSELFLKYIRRCDPQGVTTSEAISAHEARILKIKADLREKQQKILDLWNKQKKQLDCCQTAIFLEATVEKIINWIDENGETFLKRSSSWQSVGVRKDQIDSEIESCNTFMVEVKEQRAKVRMVLELAQAKISDGTLDESHGKEMEKIMGNVRSRFEVFCSRLNEYENSLLSALGRKSEINKTKEELSLDRRSDSSLESKIESSKLNSDPSRKVKEPMMELIKSEKDYIDDLRLCINVYLEAYRFSSRFSIPAVLRNKEKEIFGNIEQLYKFHCETFLPELVKYENDPEDVGYCFVFSVDILNNLYTEYCVNKEQNNYLIAIPEAIDFFSSIRKANNLEHNQDLQSLVIKPVQRITRYRLMLEQLVKYCTHNVEMIKDAYDVVVSVPRKANDLMHLGNFDGYKDLGVLGEFVMQETFIVWDPRSLFKKGSERQVFLFELCVVFAKKKENPSTKGVKYVYKNRLMLSEVNVCEHVEGDSSKFALRQGNMPNNELRTDLKAANEQCKVHWVKKIRELMQGLMTANYGVGQSITARSLRSHTSTTSSSDRASKDSESFNRNTDDQNSMRSCASSESNFEV